MPDPGDADLPRPTNRLSHEKSPYLLQHAHNPVDWFPWGPEALETARVTDRPLFLSVGYSACHWCHVMERESFENETVAHLLNEHFVCIKVDREERPDIDEIYMTAVQMMTGQGGWPMSVFLTPDGRPFYGGTYFPPEGRHGRIGFKSLIVQLADAYQSRRAEVEQIANSVAEDLRQTTRQRPLSAPEGPLNPHALLQTAVLDLGERFDAETGGFGGAPKFPPHHALRLLLAAMRAGSADAALYVTTTLDRIALGGIYDHIGGGFHRYATDAVWLLPHFEKMLYDNALLARVYADAFAVTGREAYARIARETCDWVIRDMTDPAGGFHAALDADSEGVEGKYYVWTPDEILSILGAESGTAFCKRYNVLPQGNFREEATGHPTGTNIPYLSVGATDMALPDTLEPSIVAARTLLRAHRDKRIPPGKDDKVITSWNGLMIGALAYAGSVLSEPRYLDAARRAANFCLTTLRPDGVLKRRYAQGEAGLPAFLDDYSYLADGLLDLFEATGETHWADEARSLADVTLISFWDPEEGGFFFSANNYETLVAQSKDLLDGALPSANGVAARMLARLGNLPAGERYGDAARTLLYTYRGLIHRAPQGTQTLVLAALDAFPEETPEMAPVALSPQGSPTLTLRPGESTVVTFALSIADGYHVNARQPGPDYLIPTTAALTSDLPASIGPVGYPAPIAWHSAGEEIATYQGVAPFTVPIVVATDAPSGHHHLTLRLRYQVCNETECLAPMEQTATINVEIVADK